MGSMRSGFVAGAVVLLTACGCSHAQVQVSVDRGVQYQTIEGFGATISGSYSLRPWRFKDGPFYVEVDLDSVGLYDSIISGLGLTAVRTAIDPGFNPQPGQYGVTGSMRIGS